MLKHTVDEHGEPVARHAGRLVWSFSPSPGKPGHARPFLAAGARPPSSFAITLLPVAARVSVVTGPFGPAGHFSLATAALTGEDAEGRIRATMTNGNWRTFPVPGEPPEAVADTNRLEAARRHFFSAPHVA